jgi:hypothetical protein
MTQALLSEEVKEEWEKVIVAEGVAPITSTSVRNNTIRLLENTKKMMLEAGNTTASGFGTGASAGVFDPVLISMVRKTMPSLIANELVGVQPMSGPTGLIFAMHANSKSAAGAAAADIFDQAADTALSGPHTTAQAEALGTGSTTDSTSTSTTAPVVGANPWAEVNFNIDKVSVTAKTRALKASYTLELAQDLKAIHGLDAESELTTLLSGELVAEMNREIVAAIRTQAIVAPASDWGGVVANTFQTVTDTNARWEVETYKALYMEIVRQANKIAQNTRRGLGNVIVCSANVAAALESATTLDVAALSGNLNTSDFIGTTFAGILGGRFKLFIDPYATVDFVTIGYKGATEYDAGIFYCPYVPLQLLKSTGEEDFSPRLGMKTRYGLVTNPMTTGTAGANDYYRDFLVTFD